MTDSTQPLAVERIARLLGQWRDMTGLSVPPGQNPAGDESAADSHIQKAIAILQALREADSAMAAAGDAQAWARMIDATLTASGQTANPDPKVARGIHSKLDERLDESFPASDPPPVSPHVD